MCDILHRILCRVVSRLTREVHEFILKGGFSLGYLLTHLRSVSWDSVRRLCRVWSNIHCHSNHNRRPDWRPGHCPERAWCRQPSRWRILWVPSGVSSYVGRKHENTKKKTQTHAKSIGEITQSFIEILRFIFTVFFFGGGFSVLIWKVFRAVVKFVYYAQTHTHMQCAHCKKKLRPIWVYKQKNCSSVEKLRLPRSSCQCCQSQNGRGKNKKKSCVVCGKAKQIRKLQSLQHLAAIFRIFWFLFLFFF